MTSKQILLVLARALWSGDSINPAGLILSRVSLIAAVLGRDRLVQAACEITRACNLPGEGVEVALRGLEDAAYGRTTAIKIAPSINSMDWRIRPLFEALLMDRVSADSEAGAEQVAAYVDGALFHAAEALSHISLARGTWEAAFAMARTRQSNALCRLVSLGELEQAIEALPR